MDKLIPFEQVLEEELRDPAFRAIGVSPETIRRLEIGEHFPSPRTLARIESFAESTADR
jgi:hypothetical protein